jgi:hypothetical protein
MSRFYFNFVHGPDLFEDTEGTELPDQAAARHHAVLAAKDVMRSRFARFGPDWSGWSVRVCNGTSSPVLTLSFAEAERAPQL